MYRRLFRRELHEYNRRRHSLIDRLGGDLMSRCSRPYSAYWWPTNDSTAQATREVPGGGGGDPAAASPGASASPAAPPDASAGPMQTSTSGMSSVGGGRRPFSLLSNESAVDPKISSREEDLYWDSVCPIHTQCVCTVLYHLLLTL